MKTSKKLQTLQGKNLLAASDIYLYLKQNKCISNSEFKKIFYENRPELGGMWEPTSPHNYYTTERFLIQRGIMTVNIINGLRIYTATQRCIRTKSFENAIKAK